MTMPMNLHPQYITDEVHILRVLNSKRDYKKYFK